MATPERIEGWQHTQLSIARHFGGITYNGREYRIDYDSPGQPLVRLDVLARERRAARAAEATSDTTADQRSLL